MNRIFLAAITSFAFAATACGGSHSAADRETASRADLDDDRDDVRDERRADRDERHEDREEAREDRDERHADAREADEARDQGDDGAPIATDQGNGEVDLSITQQIRQAVVADDRLSFGAKNVTIITRDGIVTLRGEVDSAEERAVLQEIAHRVDGVRRIDVDLDVDAD